MHLILKEINVQNKNNNLTLSMSSFTNPAFAKISFKGSRHFGRNAAQSPSRRLLHINLHRTGTEHLLLDEIARKFMRENPRDKFQAVAIG